MTPYFFLGGGGVLRSSHGKKDLKKAERDDILVVT